MSATVQKEIAKQKQRGKARVKQTAEVFTPMDLCLRKKLMSISRSHMLSSF